jgi:hypothetical protein
MISPPRIDAQVTYLLIAPSTETQLPVTPERIEPLKDAPYFDAVDIDIRTIGRQTMDVDGVEVSMRRQVYDALVQIAECTYTLPDALSGAALQAKSRIQISLEKRLNADLSRERALFEEYTVLSVRHVDGAPDEFLDRNGQAIARFIRSQREFFGPREIQEVLTTRVRYSEQDLTVIDWEGAVVIAPNGDFQSDIELLKIGNYQLLRYRLLDRAIERNLQKVGQNLQEGAWPSVLPRPAKRALREAVEQRLALMLDFEKIDQSLLLIGDWYTAKLYLAMYDEFYLDEWKAAIKGKLESLESITQIVQQNFTFSWSRFLELMQIAGWLILLIGYFILFFLDIRAYQ